MNNLNLYRSVIPSNGGQKQFNKYHPTMPSTHAYPDFQIRLHPFICQITTGATMTLSEHHTVCWKTPDQLLTLDWADADVAVVKTYLDRAVGMQDLNRLLKNVASVAEARQNEAKKRSLHDVNEHFEPNFNAASASAVVFQQPVKDQIDIEDAREAKKEAGESIPWEALKKKL